MSVLYLWDNNDTDWKPLELYAMHSTLCTFGGEHQPNNVIIGTIRNYPEDVKIDNTMTKKGEI